MPRSTDRHHRPATTTSVPLNSKRRAAWILSAYRAESHARWADWLVSTFDEFDWQRLELPGRHFSWRIRGNPLSWLDALPASRPDLIVATSMVDLATLKGLHSRLADVRTMLYFHENQFAYPASDAQTTSIEAQMVQLYAALSADCVLFNSDYNSRTFIDGVDALLGGMPDLVPTGVSGRIAGKSGILPVPIDPIRPADPRDAALIAWNHRWEYDKNPDLFADAMIALAERGAEFRLALLGQRHRRRPDALARLREALPDRIVVDGALPGNEYRAVLARARIAVSTAAHEFHGLAMLEAASAGCLPLVPDALCYPDIYPPEYRYPAGDRAALVARLADWLDGNAPVALNVERWAAVELEPSWRKALLDEDTRFYEAIGQSRDA